MKKVLLTTSALVAFAGFASAEVTFGGEATVGYNDVEENGIYTDGSLDITGSAEFDGGVSLSVVYGLDLYSGKFDSFPTITVTTQWATLTVGDVEYAAVDMFNQLDGMTFAFIDNMDWREVNDEVVARVDATIGGFAVGVSADTNIVNTGYNVASNVLSIGAKGEFGGFRFSAGYDQGGLWNHDADGDTRAIAAGPDNLIYGVSAGTTFGGFDIDVAYMFQDQGDIFFSSDSIGVQVSTTMGGVGLTGYYALNDAESYDKADAYGVSASYTSGALTLGAYWDGTDADIADASTSNFGVDVEYVVNDSMSAFAGYDEADGFYVYGTLAAGAATVGAGYAEYTEAGPDEIREGVSVWITMPF